MPKHVSVTAILALLILMVSPALAADGPGDAVEGAIEDFAVRSRVPETIVTVTRGPRPTFELPRVVTVIDEETFDQYSPRHPVDVLTRRDPGIVMDVRTTTTGDPVMRGFAGFNILTLVDGNSLSTLWGEGGFGADDMYGKVDPDTIARIEVVRGPHSVLYGSSALGGVINLISRSSPIDYTASGIEYGGAAKTSYMSNMQGVRSRVEAYLASPDFKILTGVSHAHYDDGHDGDGRRLRPTGGYETNYDFRGDWRILPGHELTVSVMQVVRKNMHRFYRPTQDNENRRTGVGVTWRADELLGFMNPFELRAYYQKKRDERRFFDKNGDGYSQTETWSADLQASSDAGGRHRLTYGVHAHVDDGRAPDDEQFFYYRPLPRESDSPDSLWANYGIYVQDEWEAIVDLLDLTAAVRYDYFVFNSRSTDEYRLANTLRFRDQQGNPLTFPDLRSTDFFRDKIGAFTGGLGATVKLERRWRLLVSYSRGFRQYAPNFGFRQLGNGVLIPNELLDPVTSNNYELGLRTRYDGLHAEAFVYHSHIQDWQELRPSTFNGSDWFDFNGNGTRDANESVITQKPVGDATVFGVEAKATLFLTPLVDGIPPGYSIWGGFAWNKGKTDDHEPFRHTQPARGLLGLRYDDSDPDRRAFVEVVTEMVARYDEIPSDRQLEDLAYRRDPQDKNSPLLRAYAGVPGYTVISLYAGINLCSSARLTIAVENLTNRQYRRAHSRMDAFGINFITTLEVDL